MSYGRVHSSAILTLVTTSRPGARWFASATRAAILASSLALVVGCGTGNSQPTGAVTPTSAPTAAAAGSTATPDMASPSVTPTPDCNGDDFKFGETACFTTRAGRGGIPLKITVDAPTPFTPSATAKGYDALASVLRESPLLATNIYFTLTISNESPDETYDATWSSDVTGTGDDKNVVDISDPALGSSPGKAGPGETIVIKDAYSVTGADNLTYKLRIDGLAGKRFQFHR